MLNKLIQTFQSMDLLVKKIMQKGIHFCLFLAILSTFILLTYAFFKSPQLYYIGLGIFQISLFWAVEFIICAMAIDTIKRGIA